MGADTNVLELAWVLKSKKFSKADIANALDRIVRAPGVRLSHRDAVVAALARFKEAPASVGFADCLIVEDASEAGSDLHTFDQDLCDFDSRAELPQFPRLMPLVPAAGLCYLF